MIIFKKIRWKNFLSTGNIFTEVDLSKNSSTLIIGENGSGKSTILDALTYVLFNKPFRDINKPALINSITQKDLVVEVEFEVAKQQYKIVRGQKPAAFEVYKNDVLLNQNADHKDYQKILETQILKLNYKTFCQVVVLGTASYTPFMKLQAQQRREIVEDILDLKIFSIMNLLLKDQMSKTDREIFAVENKKRSIQEKINLTVEHMKEISNSNEVMIAEKKARIASAKDQIRDIQFEITNLTRMIDLNYSVLKEAGKSIQTQVKYIKVQAKLLARKSKLESDIKFFSETKQCHICFQEITDETKHTHVEVFEKDLTEVINGLKKIDEKLKEFEGISDKYENIQSEINKYNLEIAAKNNSIESLSKYIEEYRNDIEKASEEKVDTTRLDEFEKDLKATEGTEKELTEQSDLFQITSILLKDTGIKSKIVKQYIPVINKLINQHLAIMDFFVNFTLNERFEETILSRYRDSFSYSSFSEGEKFRINLAILFTWRAIAKLRNSVNTNILFLDEVMDSSLDNNGTEEFLKIINQLADGTNVFVISHKMDSFSKFDNYIQFQKKNNFSRMVDNVELEK